MQEIESTPRSTSGTFPFKLEDLVSWTVKRKDGTVTKFVLTESAKEEIAASSSKSIVKVHTYSDAWTTPSRETTKSLSTYCTHVPKEPIFEGDDIRLYVGDWSGAKQERDNFDFVIDGGDVVPLKTGSPLLEGDPELIKLLTPYTVDMPETRVLKIDWFDRKAPDVVPEFWSILVKQLRGDVMTCCHGGHGRSGSAFVCLLLNLAPDYDVLDAVIHLRAVHCPRAIESKVQHDYLNDVGKFLGRTPNAHDAEGIKDYKEAFRKSTKPSAVRSRKVLGWS